MLCDSIEPFQDLFYYNCFHSALFAIIQANGGDYRDFIVNGIPYLEIQQRGTDVRLLYRFSFIEEYPKLLLQNGLKGIKMERSDNVIRFTKHALKKGMPVIINVDGYELPYRDDLYHKIYWPHSLLVTGYHEQNDTFRIIDQPSLDNVTFNFYNLNSENLQLASDLFIVRKQSHQLYSSEDNLAFFVIGKPKTNDTLLPIVWKEHFKQEKSKIESGIDKALELSDYFTNLLLNISENSSAGMYFLDGLNDIVKQKKWEVAVMVQLKLLSNEEGDEHYSLWKRTRDLAGLVVLSGKPRNKTVYNFQRAYNLALESEIKIVNEMTMR